MLTAIIGPDGRGKGYWETLFKESTTSDAEHVIWVSSDTPTFPERTWPTRKEAKAVSDKLFQPRKTHYQKNKKPWEQR